MQLLTSADAPNLLADTLAVTNIRIRNIKNLAKTGRDYTTIEAEDVLTIAKGIFRLCQSRVGLPGLHSVK